MMNDLVNDFNLKKIFNLSNINYVLCELKSEQEYIIIEEHNFFKATHLLENKSLLDFISHHKNFPPQIFNEFKNKLKNKEDNCFHIYSYESNQWIEIDLHFLNSNQFIILEKFLPQSFTLINKETISYLQRNASYDELLSAVFMASNQLLENNNYYDSLVKSIEIIGNAFKVDHINLCQFNKQINEYQITKIVEWKNEKAPIINIQYQQETIHHLYQRLMKDHTIICEPKDCVNYFIDYGVSSTVFIAIQFQNELLGFIELDEFEDKQLWTNELVHLLKIFTNSLTEAMVRNKREQDIKYSSYRDSLTNLYNRRYFEEAFKKLSSSSTNLPLSLIVSDVNGLKLVNDSFGHVQGDLIIKSAADILLSQKREQDIISRWGGDEFIILLPKTTSEEVHLVIEKIMEKASKTYVDFIPISISLAASTTEMIDCDLDKLFKDAEDLMYKHKLMESPIIKRKIIQSIIKTLHARSVVEEEHSKRVSELCAQIGQAMNFDEFGVKHLKTVGLYHDIGKIAINENILNKPGKLSQVEYEEIKRHSEIGYRILSSVNEMSDTADFILKHHERIDGTGYPYGLKGDEIPTITKILTIAEAYDTMSSNHSYKDTLTQHQVIQELIKNSCTQFDPVIVRTLVEKVLKQPWYSVLYGVNNTVVKWGESFDPLEGVFVKDALDPELSIDDIEITGFVDTKISGNYLIIYSITNTFGNTERIIRKVAVGNLIKTNMIDEEMSNFEKLEIDGADFSYTKNQKEMMIDLYKGGSNPWSAQLIYKGIILEKGKQYVISFDAYTNKSRKEVHISIGWLDTENNYWHSFLSTSDNKFFITPYRQSYKLIFKIEKDTHLKSELKFEFGTGEHTKIHISNINLYEFV